MKYVKDYIKALCPIVQRKLFDIDTLTKEEHMVLVETYVKKELIKHTCDKLFIGKTTYYSILDKALVKVACKIRELDQIFALNEQYLLDK